MFRDAGVNAINSEYWLRKTVSSFSLVTCQFRVVHRTIRSIYFNRVWESVHEIMNELQHATVFELYFIELFNDVLLQIRNQTPVLTLNFSELHK